MDKRSALLSLLLLLTACTPASSPVTETPDLARYYEQKTDFQPCTTPVEGTEATVDGECAQVEVPLDYEEPGGAVARIAVFRVPARGGEKIGSLFVNPGGPGYPGIGYAAPARANPPSTASPTPNVTPTSLPRAS